MFFLPGTIPTSNAIFKESIDAEFFPKNIASGRIWFTVRNVELELELS